MNQLLQTARMNKGIRLLITPSYIVTCYRLSAERIDVFYYLCPLLVQCLRFPTSPRTNTTTDLASQPLQPQRSTSHHNVVCRSSDHRPVTTHHPPSTTCRRPSTNHHQPPPTDHPPPATNHHPPTTRRPATNQHEPPPTNHCSALLTPG